MVRKVIACRVIPVLILTLLSTAEMHAGMIGDTLTFRRVFPDVDTDFAPPVSTTVTADNTDIVTLQPPFFDINPSDTSILIDLQGSSSMVGSATVFDGIVITGFSELITNATATSNVSGFVFDLNFDSSSIALNLAGPFDATTFVDISVETSPTTNVVPEPNTLAVFSVFAMFGCARRRKKALP